MKFRYALSFHLTPRKKYIKLSCNIIYIHIMSPYVTSQSIKIVWKSTAQLLFGSHPHGVPSVPLPDICRGLGRGVGSQQPREQKSLREASCWGPDWTLISCAAQLLNQLGRHCRILLDSVPDFPSEREPEDFFRKNHFLIHHVFHRMFSWWSWSGSIWLHMAPLEVVDRSKISRLVESWCPSAAIRPYKMRSDG